MVDWSRYLNSLCEEYARWWQVYTLSDVVGQQRSESEIDDLLLDLGLIVETVEPQTDEAGQAIEQRRRSEPSGDSEPGEPGQRKIERLGVLEGLRKYAAEHVLLVGRPGSGKSTGLVRLLLEQAEICRRERQQEGDSSLTPIPILVELRYFQTSVVDLMRDFLKRHQVLLSREEIEELLFQGQLFVLVDGLNELPSEEARRELKAFRQNHPDTLMVFTTRDLGVGGNLGIVRKLEMQSLTEPQMQQFVRQYLPDQGDRMLRQLGQRLREFGQTPLLLWMLCSLFRQQQKIPDNLGLVFRQFTQSYDRQLKQDIPVTKEFRQWCPKLLQQLAWAMTQGDEPTEIQVAIAKQRAVAILSEFLQGKVPYPENTAASWLEDLLNYHLIQTRAGDQIEFRHQLIQEYYTAEHLLSLLPGLDDDRLKRQYLNYLKWTEPIALMLALVDQEALAIRVVDRAFETDLRLGAKLAGAVSLKYQQHTIRRITELDAQPSLIVELLGVARSPEVANYLSSALDQQNANLCRRVINVLEHISSEAAIPALLKALDNQDANVRWTAADALAKIGSEAAVSGLLKALEHKDADVRRTAADALAKIGSEAAIPGLLKALEDQNPVVRLTAADALAKIGSEAAVSGLLKALEHQDADVRRTAADALAKIGSEAATPELLKALEDQDADVRQTAANALAKIGSEAAILGLLKALEDQNSLVRLTAADALAKLGSEAAISGLLKALEHQDADVRRTAANALAKLGSEAAISGLLKALDNQNPDVRWIAANALAKLGSEAAIPTLLKALDNQDPVVRRTAANALAKIGSEAVIPTLLKALDNQDADVRLTAANALAKLGSEAAISGLLKALDNQDADVRRTAAHALADLGSEAAIPALLKALEDQDSVVRLTAANALADLGSEAAILGLLKALEDQNSLVRLTAANALAKLGSEAAISGLLKALEHQDADVRRTAANALAKIGSKAAISGLLKALDNQNPDVCLTAANALAKLGSEAAIPTLLKALEDQDSVVRLTAANALADLGSEAAISGLLKALEDQNPVVRLTAANALAKLGSEAAIPTLLKALDNQDANVRRTAANGLGRISSEHVLQPLICILRYRGSYTRRVAAEALGDLVSRTELKLSPLNQAFAVMALLEATQDRYRFVRRFAAEALSKIGNPKPLAELWQQQLQAEHTEILIAITAIQERCKFYNYTLTQSPPPAPPRTPIAPQLTSAPASQPSTRLMHILHLSDLHFGNADRATLWLNQLAEDLHNDLQIPAIDALIISGDIASYATPEEYQAATQFLNDLCQEFAIAPEQIILVPGNHDLNWQTAKGAYSLKDKSDCTTGELQEGKYIPVSEEVVRVRDKQKYQQRFANFSSFYQAIKNTPYPLDYDQQYTLNHLPDCNLLILGLNSAWELDHHYKSRASINPNALSNAITEIRRNPDYRNCLKLAVWHHPLDSPWNDRITDQGFLQQLAVAGFRFFLHGHIHKAETSLYRYDMSQNGRKLDRICAGTFGAPTRELNPAYPWQYNLLKFSENQLTVYTRRREEANGAWKPDARWLQGPGKTSLDYYAIEL